MEIDNTSTERSEFDQLLDDWPGGHLIGNRWEGDARYVIVVEYGDGNWAIDAVNNTFPTKWVNDTGTSVTVAPYLAARICEWYASEYGPYVVTAAVSSFEGLEDLDDDALVSAFAAFCEQYDVGDAGAALDDAARDLPRLHKIAARHGFGLDKAFAIIGGVPGADELDEVLRALSCPPQ